MFAMLKVVVVIFQTLLIAGQHGVLSAKNSNSNSNTDSDVDPWWYNKIGHDISQNTQAVGVIQHRMDTVWDKIKDFGNWNFYDGLKTTCVERDSATGLCVIRNVTQKAQEFGGYKFFEEHYQEKQDINARNDKWSILDPRRPLGIYYQRVISPGSINHNYFSAKMSFELLPDFTLTDSGSFDLKQTLKEQLSHPLEMYTVVNQSARFYQSNRNINPLVKDLAQFGFLQVINALRMSFEDDTQFAGYAEIKLKHRVNNINININRHNSTLNGGILQVKSGSLVFEKEIKTGLTKFTTTIEAGFDQIANGWVEIKILSNDQGGISGRKVICSNKGVQLDIESKQIGFDDCDLSVIARVVLPSPNAEKIFNEQRKSLNFGEFMILAQEAGEQLAGYGLMAVNQQAAGYISLQANSVYLPIIPLDMTKWVLTFGSFDNIPMYVKQLGYDYYGFTVSHLMKLVKGHVDWFIGNLQPIMLAAKSITQDDPWTNFLIPESGMSEEARILSTIWGEDDEFCRQFLQGASPFDITKVVDKNIIPNGFFLEDMYKFNINSNDDKLYYAEYSMLSDIMEYIPDGNILYPDTFVLFRAVDETISPTSLLEVVGIQLERNGIIYHKNDGMKWRYLLAKMYVQNAAIQTQEFLWHLGIGHFLPEAFIAPLHNAFVADTSDSNSDQSEQCDSSSPNTCNKAGVHPIYRVLKPHFQHTLAMGSLARIVLDGRATKVADIVFASGHKGVIQLIDKWYAQFSFNDFDIEKQISQRNIGKNDLPKYYFRDDSLRVYKILKDYCTDIVNSYYDSDDSVKSDLQLIEFARLSSQSVNGFTKKFTSRKQLSKAMADIMAIPVIVHTSTNYPQAPYNYLPVNRPFRLKKRMSDFDFHLDPEGDHERDITPNDINDALPNYIESFISGMFMHVLTGGPDNSLLDTAGDQTIFADIGNKKLEKKLQESQEKFYKKLVKLGNDITERTDQARKRGELGYPYFHPATTCTSTNI